MTTHSIHHHHEKGKTSGEVLPDASAVATVVLDIGPGFGALVIHTSESLDGHEIEIRPEHTQWLGTHTAVRPRLVPSGTQFAAVFGSLPEGRYELRVRDGEDGQPALCYAITSGAVTSAEWPEYHPGTQERG
jgi:hypothetical protein